MKQTFKTDTPYMRPDGTIFDAKGTGYENDGPLGLSEKQIAVLQCLAYDKSVKEIAAAFGVDRKAISCRLHRARETLGVKRVEMAVAMALTAGVIKPKPVTASESFGGGAYGNTGLHE